jgi:hypothetical protein
MGFMKKVSDSIVNREPESYFVFHDSVFLQP